VTSTRALGTILLSASRVPTRPNSYRRYGCTTKRGSDQRSRTNRKNRRLAALGSPPSGAATPDGVSHGVDRLSVAAAQPERSASG
jgi:hypothetical protein